MFTVNKGKFELTNKGTLTTTKEDGILIYGSTNKEDANYTEVTIGKDVTIQAHDYAMYIGQNTGKAYGVTVNINGTLSGDTYGGFYINGLIQDNEKNYPIININDGAVLKSSDEFGIYAGGYAKWNIGKVNITGKETGLGIKAGKFIIDGSTITATGEDKSETVTGNGNKMTGAGAAIQFETNKDYADHIEVEIKSATVTSEQGYAFLEYVGQSNIVSLSILDGTFKSANGLDIFKVTDNFNITKFIKGGTFSNDVTKYVADNLVSKKFDNEYVVATENKINLTEVTNGTVTIDKTKAIAGEVVSITININEGYELTSLKAVDKDGKEIKVENNKFTMPDSEVTVTAIIEKVKVESNVETINPETKVEEVTVGVKENEVLEEVLLDSLTEILKDEENKQIADAITNNSAVIEIEFSKENKEDLRPSLVEEMQKVAGKAQIKSFFDISVVVKSATNGNYIGSIPTLTKEIEMIVLLPEELKNTDNKINRTYYMIREHEGKIEKLPATLSKDGNSLIFKSNEFSTYALAYEDATNPQTVDSISSYIILGSIAVISMVGIAIVVKKKRLFN